MKECFNCHKKYKSSSSLFHFMNMSGFYNAYCSECFKKALIENGYGNIAIENIKTKKVYKVSDMTQKMLKMVERDMDVTRMNQLLSNPEKLREVQETFLDHHPEFAEKLKSSKKEASP